jgi:tetratricopeptide (TPR) repeat protein
LGDYITSIGLYDDRKLEIRQVTDDLVYMSRVSGVGRNWLYVKHYVGTGDDEDEYLEDVTDQFPWPLHETIVIDGALRGVFAPRESLDRYIIGHGARIVATLRKITGWGRRLKKVRLEADAVYEIERADYGKLLAFVDGWLPKALRFGAIEKTRQEARVERATDHLQEQDRREPALAAIALEVVAHAVRHRLRHITVSDSEGAADYRLLGPHVEEGRRLIAPWDEKGDRLRKASDREIDRRFSGAEALKDAGQHARARKIFHQLAGNKVIETATLFYAGECSYELGELWRAAAEWSAASLWDDRRDVADSIGNRGFALYKLGYHDFAMQCFDQSLAVEEIAGQRANRGELLLAMGEPKRGFVDLRRALAMDPEDDDIRKQYVRACKMLKIAPRFPKSRKKRGRR